MSKLASLALRAFAFVFTLIITGLIGNVIASNIYGSRSAMTSINFAMFVAAWSWVALLFGIVAAFLSSMASMAWVTVTLDAFAVLFNFIGAVVLSARLRAVDCDNIRAIFLPRGWIAFGSNNDEKRCREIQASLVFMWFNFVVFCGCLFFSVAAARGGFGFGRPFKKSSGGAPNMSQVA